MFSMREQRVTSLRVNEGVVIAAIAYRGILAADMPDGPAAGRLVQLTGASEFSFDGNRIGELVERS